MMVEQSTEEEIGEEQIGDGRLHGAEEEGMLVEYGIE